jgi:hypothetical protein
MENGPAVLLPRRRLKLGRGAKDKELAMSDKPNTAVAVIGIDIGKNFFHLVGHDKRGAITRHIRRDNEWLGDMIKRIRDSAGAHPMSAALEELEGINDFSKIYHHDTNPGTADSEAINDGELQGYVQRTLTIVGGY